MQRILWQAQKKHRKLFRTQWNWVSIHCFSFLPIASLNSLRAFGRLAVRPPLEIRALRPCKWWNLSFDWINWWNLKVILNIELCWSLRFLNEATLSLTRVPVDCRGLRLSPETFWFRKIIFGFLDQHCPQKYEFNTPCSQARLVTSGRPNQLLLPEYI